MDIGGALCVVPGTRSVRDLAIHGALNAAQRETMTDAQRLLQMHLKEIGVDTVPEFRFAAPRKFSFDLYSERWTMGFEADGGRWKRGHRSSRDTNMHNEKYNLAQMLGYRVMTFTNEEIENGNAKEFLKEWLEESR